MAYDNDPRFRDERPREDQPHGDGPRGSENRGGRGFFERAGDEISSWFGDDDAERRREQDDRSGGRGRHDEHGRQHERGAFGGRDGRDFSGGRDRAAPSDYPRQQDWNRDTRGQNDRFQPARDDYRPYAGDYGRAGERHREERERGSGIGAAVGAAAGAMFGNQHQSSQAQSHQHDPHYAEWRQKQIDQLDSDYADYRREHQSKFDNDFSGWRGQRQSKRQILTQVREHMEVVGSDELPVGKVDKVQGDKIILTRDSQGGVHKSLGCAAIDRVEGDRLFLTQTADEAKRQLVEERQFSERNDGDQRATGGQPRGDAKQGDGPHILERSFSGTYEN